VDLGGEERIRVVELRQELVQEGGGLDLLRLLEEEVAPVLEHAAADDENADRDVVARLEEAEHVHVLAAQRLDDLALRHVLDGAERVAIRGGHLEVFRLRGGEHLLLEARLELRVAALEEEDDVGHGAVVRLLRGQAGHARAQARVEVVVQAGARQLAVDLERARPDLEVPRDHPHDAPREASPERAEVGVSVVEDAARIERLGQVSPVVTLM
jgi:hypothetical protein